MKEEIPDMNSQEVSDKIAADMAKWKKDRIRDGGYLLDSEYGMYYCGFRECIDWLKKRGAKVSQTRSYLQPEKKNEYRKGVADGVFLGFIGLCMFSAIVFLIYQVVAEIARGVCK